MDPKMLPVYLQKNRILEALEKNQVIVVESPTGSGKTTQLPVIFHEAGYGRNGVIGVTQPRRIAAISVSEFIARQLGVSMPGIVGYKMRFEDLTEQGTVIKIMTDGILLQEMKLDPGLSRYSVIMVDEAHERSLNIDFILGLLKRVLEARPEFKVIVSSATINAEVFSAYFGDCPIVKIETQMYPVTLVYDPPASAVPSSGDDRPGQAASTGEALIQKIEGIVTRIISERREGDILIFLPGERMIKDCIQKLLLSEVRRSLHIIPLYARLGKDEQERVFEKAPFGKTKVIVSTNIAETSVTIDGVTSVLDSGLAKLNFYNPKTFTASLVEVPTSKASSNQRKGRAGRTRPGSCYRLYGRDDFENRQLFTMEEIYRTDLSEVVLRMAELGIDDFERFDFVSKPSKSGIAGAVDTLNLLDALTPDRKLSRVGELMCKFPLLPRHSRMIVEAILAYPSVVEEVVIAAAFLSNQGPFVLPPGEEMEARRAHHAFRDPAGDFVSYLTIFKAFKDAKIKAKFCERNYLDERTMLEIHRVKEQIELIVSDIGIPVSSGGPTEDYLCAVSRGLIQFVCVKQDRGLFRSLTADRIQIHPGSVMYKENPQFIVAGEIVRTTRMYAMSVSPLQKHWLAKISPMVAQGLLGKAAAEVHVKKRAEVAAAKEKRDFTNRVKIGSEVFDIEMEKKKRKCVVLEWPRLKKIREELAGLDLSTYRGLKGTVRSGGASLLDGEKLDVILKIAGWLDLDRDLDRDWPRKRNFDAAEESAALVACLDHVLQVTRWKPKSRELGFVALFSDASGVYWFRVSRGFHTALNESIAALESMADDLGDKATAEEKEKISALYRRLSTFFER
ncbi:MAG: ATP-dependent RNA helicase [Spirochaetes bacterium]|nr:ATP-dependent RNA helicase [Spirochaetota bacterium]